MEQVLIVEDDPALARGVAALLREEHYDVDQAADAEHGISLLNTRPYDLLLLDVRLPGMSGFDLLRRLNRKPSDVAVMILTARDRVEDKVMGLDLGADDYVLKPFDPIELCARVRALLRRRRTAATQIESLGSLTLDRSCMSARVGDRKLDLRRREWAVLEGLMACPGRVVLRERLAARVFSQDDEVAPNALEVHVGRLRKKLEPDGPVIRTVRGFGYLIEAS